MEISVNTENVKFMKEQLYSIQPKALYARSSLVDIYSSQML